MDFPSSIGTLRIGDGWPHLLFYAGQHTLTLPAAEPRIVDVQITVVPAGDLQRVRAAERGAVDLGDGVFLLESDRIRGWIMEGQGYGRLMDWLWYALPVVCAPPGWVAVHAAAVVRDGVATVILGGSGSGKTSRVVRLVREGAKVLSDDIVLISEDGVRARGWETLVRLHPESAMAIGGNPLTLDVAGKVRVALPAAQGREYVIGDVETCGTNPPLQHVGPGFGGGIPASVERRLRAMAGLPGLAHGSGYLEDEKRGKRLRIVACGATRKLPDGETWRIVGADAGEPLGRRFAEWRERADALAFVNPGAEIPQEALADAVAELGWHPNQAIAHAQHFALARMTAGDFFTGHTLADLVVHTYLHAWREPGVNGMSTPRVCFANRDPFREPMKWWGGDMVMLLGYLHGLHVEGWRAGFRAEPYGPYEDWDLVHLFHCEKRWPWAGRIAHRARAEGKPLVVSTLMWQKPSRNDLEAVISEASVVLCFSRSEVAYLAGLFPEQAERFRTVPMGVPDGIYLPDPVPTVETRSVFVAGRYFPTKGQLQVLQACRKLDVPVAFAGMADRPGSAEYLQSMREAARGWDRARFFGYLSDEALWRQYRRAHVHVCASHHEAFGLVSLEGLACGCNIVHTENGWGAEAFGEHGTLCNPDSVDDIADAIQKELGKPRDRHGYRPLTWTEASRALLPIYAEVTA